MAANGVSNRAQAVSESEARSEAERLLADPRLHVSDRHRAFLRYIVDAVFEGRSDAVKAYSIAIDVFNRPASFDPSSDPIVRIEATRLRETLAKYYEQLGDEPGARLDIPRGRYVPVFVEREQLPSPGDDVSDVKEDVVPAAEDATALRSTVSRKPYAAIALASLAAIALAGGYTVFRAAMPAPVDTQKPFISLSLNAAQKDTMAGEAVMEDLAVSLARFGTVRLKSEAGTVRPGIDPAEQTTYAVRMRYGEDATSVSLWWQVSDAATGEAVWTDQNRRPTGTGTRGDALRALVYGVSRKIAGPVGVVNTIELRRNLPASTTGNICVLRGEFAVEQRRLATLKAARPCLEATIAADPADADAMATLARVFVWTGRTTGDDSYFGRGLELANRAATASPASTRAALAQLATQYQVGQNDASIAAGRRGVALNPENADLLAKLSMALFLSGHWEEGVRLAQQATDLVGQTIRDANFVMILDAYRQGHYAEAVFLARQVPAADTPTTVLKLAAIARLGDRPVTEQEIAAARLQHPDLDRTVAAMFSGARYDSSLKTALRTGILEAGLKSPELASNGPM
ncbi:tetratricopeptide repeat protein [Rhizobium leguminosarum]|uniref:tetratricopeptide repeat protein n=1 Tax=Rhizobium leguminosarum TaxID=384 RepID=UPI003D6DE164